MLEVINNPWNDKFINYISQTKNDLKICSPFVKYNALKEIYDNKNDNVKFELITRFKISNFYNEVSDIEAMDYALDNNCNIRAFQPLHAKIYIFDKKSVIISSANLTRQGLTSNYEYGIITDEKSIVDKAYNDFQLISKLDSCINITKEKVDDARKIIENAPHIPKIYDPELMLDKRHNMELPQGDIYTGGRESIEKGLTGWNLDIFKVIDKIDNNMFYLKDVYIFKKELQELHPENHTIEDKIRQQLQYLRDLDIIEFLGKGKYLKKYI
jgi:HKD family nuclease